MPSKPSRFSGEVQSGIARVARRLRSRMSELVLNQTELAARCDRLSQELFPREASQITRERIAKILMHCKANPGKSAARVISQLELRVLAEVLRVSPEWLTGREESRDPVLWDPLADSQRTQQILHLINEHEDRAAEVLVWAEHLISSLETPEFMHECHQALFIELDALGVHDERRQLVKIYDTIGNARRRRIWDPRQKHRKLIQFICASDLHRISEGKGEYATIRRELRKACLENVGKIVSDESLGIQLMIISDQASSSKVKSAFRDYDSVAVFDERFVLWRYHSGKVAWSEHPEHGRTYRRLLRSLYPSVISGSLSPAESVEKITSRMND
jgi:hypothetical protein